jgi:hypothetical protein
MTPAKKKKCGFLRVFVNWPRRAKIVKICGFSRVFDVFAGLLA